MTKPDLIVVGAGSAGCLLASRLAGESGLRVVLLEPPSSEAPSVDRLRPSRWLNLMASADDWSFKTIAAGGLAGRQLTWPRGRGLGGSCRINAMIWFPPTERDRRSLVDASGGCWTMADLANSLESVQQCVAPEHPLWLSEASHRFLDAAKELQDFEPMVYRRMNRRGRRWNPASLLDLNGENRQIEIVRAIVDRILWDGDRAVGVQIRHEGSTSQLRSHHGVVVCAGAVSSPAILMRSGFGPRDALLQSKIDVRCETTHVGRHLQDHLIMPVVFETNARKCFSLDVSSRDIVRWQMLGTGPVSSNVAECGGLFQDEAIQIHITPTNYLTFPKKSDASMMTLGVNLTRPSSQGAVTIASNDALDPPLIEPNYLDSTSDLEGTIDAVRMARRIAEQPPLSEWIKREVLPGPKRHRDAIIGKSIARYAQTLYHPVGTCRMGDQLDSVTDPNFAVRGAERLWIADASILPRLTTGNPNATVMTLATLAADSIGRQVAQRA